MRLSFELATPPLVFDQVWEAILAATKSWQEYSLHCFRSAGSFNASIQLFLKTLLVKASGESIAGDVNGVAGDGNGDMSQWK